MTSDKHIVLRVEDITFSVRIMQEGHKVMERTGEELKSEHLEHVYLDYMRAGIGPEPETTDHA